MQIYGSKFPISIALEFRDFFKMSKILKKSALKAPGNGQLVMYSKIQSRVSRIPLVHTCGLILDQISQCRVPSKLPQMCQKNGTFVLKNFNCSMPRWMPQVCCTPLKMVPPYSLGTCPPKNPKPHWSLVAPSSRKNLFSEGIFFWQITRTALQSPKIDIFQNWS